jgi:sucrose phosphorylase
MNLGPKIFAFKRISLDKKQTVMCISNLSSKTQNIKIQIKNKKYKELIIGTIVGKNNIVLDPFQTVWLSN